MFVIVVGGAPSLLLCYMFLVCVCVCVCACGSWDESEWRKEENHHCRRSWCVLHVVLLLIYNRNWIYYITYSQKAKRKYNILCFLLFFLFLFFFCEKHYYFFDIYPVDKKKTTLTPVEATASSSTTATSSTATADADKPRPGSHVQMHFMRLSCVIDVYLLNVQRNQCRRVTRRRKRRWQALLKLRRKRRLQAPLKLKRVAKQSVRTEKNKECWLIKYY